MPPCTTTGTTWALCGHSIYQHHPTCKHPGSRCTKQSTLVPGTCPSCTHIAYWAPPIPPTLPNHLSANGNQSTLATPTKTVKVKEEPASETRALYEMEVMDPDEYLRSEYEKHKKALEAKSESEQNATRAVKNESNKGKEVMRINSNDGVNKSFGGPPKQVDAGKEYFLQFHIKQLEEKLEKAQLQEVENNAEIRDLKAQVEILILTQSHKHALLDPTPTAPFKSPGSGGSELRRMQKEKSVLQEQLDDLKGQVSAAQASLQMQAHGQEQVRSQAQVNIKTHTRAQQVQAGQMQSNDTQRYNAQRHVTPEIGYSKEKEAHIAAITFTSPIISLVTKLKSAISPSPLEEWFGKQVKYTFESAGDGNFPRMVDGYRDFVDYIANEVQVDEEKMGDENLKKVLKECEDFVNVLYEVDNMLQ